MSSSKSALHVQRSIFSSEEKRNLLIYISGIVLYKFGLEAFNGSIITLATNRFDQDALQSGGSAHTFEKVGYVVGLNQALQCFGSMLVAPLIKHWPTKNVLSICMFLFATFTALFIVLDCATGGTFKPAGLPTRTNETDLSYYGNYRSNWLIFFFGICGIVYGTVESIHRVIPTDIVGDHEEKLQRFDALVHIFYAISGAIGAFVTGLILIPKLGNNQSFVITPILFTAAGLLWLLLKQRMKKQRRKDPVATSKEKKLTFDLLKRLSHRFLSFFSSISIGAKILFSSRKYLWIFSCYSLTLYAHRYLEDGIAPQLARRYLNNAAWAEILIGGSNFGELLGSFLILFLTRVFRTPLPWLRCSALLLLILWYIPFYYPPSNSIGYAWILASTLIPISAGWAAADIALVAHIQSSISRLESSSEEISVLGAVMSLLYSSYIVLYAVLNPLLGKYIDRVYQSQGNIRPALIYTVAVQFTLLAGIVFASTFIPVGSMAFDPKLEDEEQIALEDRKNTEALLNEQGTETNAS